MLAIPSDEVAMDILDKLNNLKIVDKTISDFVYNNKDNTHKLASDVGFLSLYILKIEDYLKEQDISSAIPLSDSSIPFATILAWELGLKLCVPIFSRKVKDPKVKIVWYYSYQNNELELFLLPKVCLEDASDVLLVDIILNDIEKLKAVSQLLKSSEVNVKGVVSIYISRDCLDFINKMLTQLVLYVSVI